MEISASIRKKNQFLALVFAEKSGKREPSVSERLKNQKTNRVPSDLIFKSVSWCFGGLGCDF